MHDDALKLSIATRADRGSDFPPTPMVTALDVGWTSYDRWEGPIFGGRNAFRLPATPDWADKLLCIVEAAEGAKFDAVNMYDRAICSVGIVQFIELGLLHVSSLLGLVCAEAPSAVKALEEVMAASAVRLEQRRPGQWRFRRHADGVWVETPEALRQMYLAGASGIKGTWTAEERGRARAWCASIANVFADRGAQRVQVEYAAPRLPTYVLGPAGAYMFDGRCPENEGIHGAARAAFLSFAVHRPSTAATELRRFVATDPKWSMPWLVALLRQLTFGPKIALYPDRYNRIRPRIESLFGVDLPDFAEELRGLPRDGLGTAAGVQSALRRLADKSGKPAWDPGPVDGWFGRRSIAALTAYQQDAGLVADGILGPKTRARMRTDMEAMGLM